MAYQTVLFDLDGTLLDTKAGVIGSLKNVLTSLELPVPPDSVLDEIMGPPVKFWFSDIYGMPPPEADAAEKKFNYFYETKGLYQSSLFDGVKDVLRFLNAHGILLGVATSKEMTQAVSVLKYHGIADCFKAIVGPSAGTKGASKSESMEKALSLLDSGKRRDAVFVGDRKYDAEGAKKVGIDFIGVLYGYGKESEFSGYTCKCLLNAPGDLKQYIITL